MNMPKSTAGDGRQPMQRPSVAGGGLRCVLDSATGRIVDLIHEQTGDAIITAETRPGRLEENDEPERGEEE